MVITAQSIRVANIEACPDGALMYITNQNMILKRLEKNIEKKKKMNESKIIIKRILGSKLGMH